MPTQDQPLHAPPAPTEGTEHVEVLVIGAGQAGLAVGWHLREQGITSFLLLDAGPEVGHVWRSRWDSLRLFTPADYDALPGMPSPAPAGTYPTKDEVADYLRGYAAAFELPVRLNTRVTRLAKTGDTFHAATSTGPITAGQVVIATGPFQTPVVPPLARHLAADVVQLHSADYRKPDQLPARPGLVVGARDPRPAARRPGPGRRRRQLRAADCRRARRHPARHRRGRDPAADAAAATPRPRPVLVADPARPPYQDRGLPPRPQAAEEGRPGHRHPLARPRPARHPRPASPP